MKKKKFLQIIILILTFTSCSGGTDISRFSAKEIEFVKMPIEVQEAIKDYYRPIKDVNINGDTLIQYGGKNQLICLDSEIQKCEHKNIWSKLVSSWLDHEELIIDDKIIIIEQGDLTFNGPFIVHDGLLYCRTNLNAKDSKDPSKDEFKILEINMN